MCKNRITRLDLIRYKYKYQKDLNNQAATKQFDFRL